MVELRNWKFASLVFFGQVGVFVAAYSVYQNVLCALTDTFLFAAFITIWMKVRRPREVQKRMCSSCAAFAVFPALVHLRFQQETESVIPLLLLFLLPAIGAAGVSAGSFRNSPRKWLLNFLADLPLGIGFIAGGVILSCQKWQKRAAAV